MSKNVIILTLAFIIAILIGILFITNYDWFSEEWLIGFGLLVGGSVGIGIYFYSKVKK